MYKKEHFRTAAAVMTLAVFLAGCSVPSIPGIENATDGSESREEENVTEEGQGEETPAQEEKPEGGETSEEEKKEEEKEKEEEKAEEKEEEKEEEKKEEEKAEPEQQEEEGDIIEAMFPIAESAVYAYYFNEEYVDSLTASDGTLFDTAMTAYAAEAVSLGTARRTMHGGRMTAALSGADLRNAAFAMFPDFTEEILNAYDPSEYFHGDREKDNFFIIPASDDPYALVTGTEEGKKGSLEAAVSVMNSKGEELARYSLTMEKYTGKDTSYAYRCSAVESVWKSDDTAYQPETETLVPILESLARDSFTDKWEKEGQEAACLGLMEWAYKNVDEGREKDVRSLLGDVTGSLIGDMDEKELIRFLAVWPAVTQGMDNLIASEEFETIIAGWQEGQEAPVTEQVLARWQILGDVIYDSIRQAGFRTLEKTKKTQ